MIILVTYSQVVVISKVRKALHFSKSDNDQSKRDGLEANMEDNDEKSDERPRSTRTIDKLRMVTEKNLREQRLKEIATQCILYALSFYLNWCALTVSDH
jgi:hypothetical protein